MARRVSLDQKSGKLLEYQKMWKAFSNGIKLTFGNLKLWLLLYIVNLLFAGLVVLPLVYYLADKLAFTKATDRLIGGFDFTVFNDFLTQYGEFPRLFTTQSLIVGTLFLLLYIYLTGGILNRFKNRLAGNTSKRLGDFWKGGGRYYWRLLRLTIYFLLIHLGIVLLFITIFNFSIKGGLERFDSEAAIYNRGIMVFSGYSFVAFIIAMIQDYIKIKVVDQDRPLIFSAFWGGIGFVFKNLLKTFGLYLINLICFLFIVLLYYSMSQLIRSDGIPSLTIFLAGQLFVIFQIGFKLLNLGSASTFYYSHAKTSTK